MQRKKNSPLEPFQNKWEAQTDIGWQLEDSFSVSETAFCTHLPGHRKACWPTDGISLWGVQQTRLFMEAMMGRKVTFWKPCPSPVGSYRQFEWCSLWLALIWLNGHLLNVIWLSRLEGVAGPRESSWKAGAVACRSARRPGAPRWRQLDPRLACPVTSWLCDPGQAWFLHQSKGGSPLCSPGL